MRQSEVRVLYMEDDPGAARLFQKRLSRLGYQVDVAPDGESGLELYRTGRYQIVAVDQRMPIMDGLQVLQTLASQGNIPPVIMVTGAGDEQVAVQALKLGAFDYIVKDTEGLYIDLIPAVIEQVLEREQLRRDKEAAQQELHVRNAELAEMVGLLQQRTEELDAFSHMVAHDLKNPLTSALLYTQLLIRRGNLDEDGQTCLYQIEESANRMRVIINDLLNLAGIHKQAVDLEPVGLGAVMQDALRQIDHMDGFAEAQIDLPDDWPLVWGHASLIEQVLTNYMTNAIKYGGHPAHIQVAATLLPDAMVHVTVQDNGMGIPSKDIPRLFKPFTRLVGDTAEGNGIGLSIVKRIIERLNGKVTVESAVGQGSIFGFTLPAYEA